jgi:2-iminobutanoate/2-iminopropanoate deaminase
MVYVSGQLPIAPVDGSIPEGIHNQVRQVLDNLENILEAANSSLSRVVRATVYISDISMWPEVNKLYAERFAEHKPARAVVPTRDLHFGCLVEIDAIAEVG